MKPGGRLGIVLPESILGNPSHGYIAQWLHSRLHVTAVINMPEALFKTSGKGGTHTKVCVLIGTLAEEKGVLSFATGVEVGKINYGTGSIPFVRTSDLSNWEIKADFKHGVSEEVYERSKSKADVRAGDILMVKDGTYLIGTTAIVTQLDLPMLFQSHIYRIRVQKPDVVSPWLLFVALNSPIVRLQVRAKRFTQDIIDTIGKRVYELAVPIPHAREEADALAQRCRRIIESRVRLRQEAAALVGSVGALSSSSLVAHLPID